jgi:hypothetical protein
MLVPADPSEMDYGGIFSFEAISAVDGSRVVDDYTAEREAKRKAKLRKRRENRDKKKKKRSLSDDDDWALEGDEDLAANSMGFSWELQSHEPRKLEIKLAFK